MNTAVSVSRPQTRGTLPAADRGQLAEAHKLLAAGRLPDAEQLYRRVLARHPRSYDALCGLAVFACELRRYDDGALLFRAALAVDPKQAEAYVNLGRALQCQGQTEAALAAIDMALTLEPGNGEARLDAATWSMQAGHADAAREWLAPLQQADASPLLAGRAAQILGDEAEAIRCFERAAQAGTHRTEASLRLGEQLVRRGRYAQALPWAEQAARGDARSAQAWNLVGASLNGLGRYEEAADNLRQALQLDVDFRPAISNFANALLGLRRHDEAALAFERLLAVWPECEYAKGMLMHCKMLACDWLQFDALRASIERDIAQGLAAADPASLQTYCDSPELQLKAARRYAAPFHADVPAVRPSVDRGAGDKIRIGYVCEEVGDVPVSHDAEGFEVVVFECRRAAVPLDDGARGKAIEAVLDIGGLDDDAAARLVQERGIEILVHLQPSPARSRLPLFARRPAAVQVALPGFAGTLGSPGIDYLIADKRVAPGEDHRFHDEAVVHLPQVHRFPGAAGIARDPALSRQAHGVPREGFVFACFADAHRLTPEVWSVWMRLLQQVPESVLWLADHGLANENLVAEASARGVVAQRLVFAPPLPASAHLARLPLADLVLDTWPCNAPVNAGDALRAGVPLLTCEGRTFAGRASASLLAAAGLDDLIAPALPAYEALALRLASSPDELARCRDRLARDDAGLFDADRYRKPLEDAYREMARRARAGQPHGPIDGSLHAGAATSATDTP